MNPNPYEVTDATRNPGSVATTTTEEADIEALALTPSARFSAGAAFSCGLLAIVLGAQGLSVFVGNALVYLYMGGSIACGLALVFGASRLRRMRSVGAWLIAAAGGGILLLNALWSVLVAVGWLFTPLPFAQCALATVASALAIMSFAPTRRADAARSRLGSSGLDLGL